MIKGTGAPPGARVFVLLTDPDDYTKKRMVQVTGFDRVSSAVSVDGVSSASVSLPNKDLRYMRSAKPKQSDADSEDVVRMLHYYKHNATTALAKEVADGIAAGYKPEPWFSPQDLIWIDYRGRDGNWYPGFTGLITSCADSVTPNAQASLVLQAKDYRRVLQYSPIVWGLNNIGGYKDWNTLLTEWQDQDISLANSLSKFPLADILKLIIDRINKMWKIATPPFFEYDFWVSPPAERDLKLSECIFAPNGVNVGRSAGSPKVADYYHSPLAGAYFDQIFKIGNSVYQQLLRNRFEFNTIEFEPAMTILSKIAGATYSFIYVDQMGNLRHEYPRYEYLPTDSQDPLDVDESGMAHHARNYYIGQGDASFLKYSGTVDEQMMSVTRVIAASKQHFLTQPKIIQDIALTGIDQADAPIMLKYGLRDVAVSDFFLSSVPENMRDVLVAYAKAIRIHLNAGNLMFNIDLDQRPDLMLNRTLVFLDRRRAGLITTMTDTYTPTSGHIRNVTCKFAYHIGDPNRPRYPWKILMEDGNSPV